MTLETNTNAHGAGGAKTLKFIINGKHFESHEQYISGAKVRELGDIPLDAKIFLVVKDWENEHIKDDSQVDLARPGIEHFFSEKIQIIVNGTPHPWVKKKISFKEVIILAYGVYNDSPTWIYTVGYEDGPKQNPEGSMIKGQEVFVKNEMIFHAKGTDES
jgi:multiubiquitin